MDLFAFDYECSYEEVLDSIKRDAINMKVPRTTPEKHYEVCDEVYKKALEYRKHGSPALAYFMCFRCIMIFEESDLRKKLPHSKKLLKESVTLTENLVKNELLNAYNRQLQYVREREKERKGIIESQLLPDENESETAEEQHLRHQQRLLMSETTLVDNTKKILNATSIPTPHPLVQQNNILPYWNVPNTSVIPIPENYIERPRRITNTSPNAYNMWNFNTNNCKTSYRRRGMVNLGNTCYINSVIQVLFVTPLGAYFLGDKYMQNIVYENGKGRLVNSFSYVMRELSRVDIPKAVSTSPLKVAVGEVYESFMNSSQQDASEFLHVLLDGIHSNLNDRSHIKENPQEIDTTKGCDSVIAALYWSQYTRQNNSVIVDKCIFQERSTLVCPLCNHISRSFAPSLGIEVPIPSLSEAVSIEDCLKAYCKEEILGPDSLYTCPHCKKSVRASKQLLFYSLPEILFVTIKRFRSFGDFSNKVMNSVAFQKQLDVSPFCCSNQRDTLYNLVGIVNHQGNIHGGHYTADSLGSDGCWSSFSDERVDAAQSPDFKLAYILCYVQKSRGGE